MSTAQGGTNLSTIREAVAGAFEKKFQLNQFGFKPCDPPLSYPEQSWDREMIAIAEHIEKAGFRISNIAKAARATFKVPIQEGIENLCKMIDEDINKSKPKPKTRSIWNWFWRRDSSA